MLFAKLIWSLLLSFVAVDAAQRPSTSVLLSNVKTLTLRKDSKTSHRRVPAVPQLKCIGGNGKGLYEVDVMRCKNQGSDYDADNVQWTCTASLPPEFRLGSTDVICEGYESSKDPYVLKGSCAVEYRLMLTTAGEEKYGDRWQDAWQRPLSSGSADWPSIIFWSMFILVVGWMIYSALFRRGPEGNGRPGNNPWGGGGGGGGNHPNGDDPPPPYTQILREDGDLDFGPELRLGLLAGIWLVPEVKVKISNGKEQDLGLVGPMEAMGKGARAEVQGLQARLAHRQVDMTALDLVLQAGDD
ncbi:MAG: hypothetical protein Q9190_005577 [Brigantiaea leucoxantha]